MTPSYRYAATLVRILDADTLAMCVDLGFHASLQIEVRVRGIYAPEAHTPIGVSATALVAGLLANQPLIIETMKNSKGNDVRSFVRWVADVFVGDRNLADLYREAGGPIGGVGV